MTKYKCSNCGHTFEEDLSTLSCPNCGEEQIQVVSSKFTPLQVAISILTGGLGLLVYMLITTLKQR